MRERNRLLGDWGIANEYGNILTTKKYYKSEGERKMPKAKVEKSVIVPTGEYTGTIVKNEVVKRGNEGQYEYHETTVRLETEEKQELRLGVPFKITPDTALGQILERFDCKLQEGEDIDTDQYLIPNSMVKFSVVRKAVKGNDGSSFEVSNIQKDTFEPVTSVEEVKNNKKK